MGAKTTKYSMVQPSYHQPSEPTTTTSSSTAFDIESGTHPTKPHKGKCVDDGLRYGVGGLLGLMALTIMLVMIANCGEGNDHPRFYIESASLSLFNLSTSHHFSSQWNMSFFITNPSNDTTMFYDNIEVSVLYKKKLLSVTILEPFYQRKVENSSVKASFASSPGIVGDWIVNAMARDMTLFGAMNFDVSLKSRFIRNPGEDFETNHWMTASCEDVKIDFTSMTKVGVMSGRLRSCSVRRIYYY